ncbi:unnamed protein product [Notodromas monacha]|uniref:PID domain-containing protein n=1 Tax=Notodromas monacha TaxID=399045 RepID=A0A7R9GA04_9CRUS|nr:unnamed protein product [Notodromas monacha]CAG0914842.1 unnamed protein product [Notodromas monacha]
MLSERRWSEGSALRFLKAKANQLSLSAPSSPSPSTSSLSWSTSMCSSSELLDGQSVEDVSSGSSSEPGTEDVPGFPPGEIRQHATDGFMKRFWRRKKSLTINEYDPSFKVIYLGNVLTGWAKGEGCVDRPLATLWKNYKAQNGKQEIQMKMTVSNSGLKAFTKEHGLTEYWSNRVTFCNTHPRFPKVFCWVYRHEGRRLKQELRCHAVLCPSEAKAGKLAQALQDRLQFALQEFRRDKLNRQKARLSLANCVYDVPSLPRRKQLLSTGMNNYRPPLERSKSAPKLKSIEEGYEESALEDLVEEDEDNEETLLDEAPIINGTHPNPTSNPEIITDQDQDDEEDEVSFAYNPDSSSCPCAKSGECQCQRQKPGELYGTLPGQLLGVEAPDDYEEEEEEEEASSSPPTSSRLLPRSSLPSHVLPGPVRVDPSPHEPRSSFSLGSRVCPGEKPHCEAGLCDEQFCSARSSTRLAEDLERLRLDGAPDLVLESNNNINNNNNITSNTFVAEKKGFDEKEILRAVTIAGLVGCFRQSKA